MARAGAWATGHPRKLVAAWALLVAVLGLLGTGIEDDVSPRPAVLEGSEAQREHAAAVREFGREDALVVALRGPHETVVRQGRLLERRLAALPGATTVSPWGAGGSVDGLMPRRGVAGVVLSIEVEGDDPEAALGEVRERIEATVRPPVRASVAGAPALADSFLDAATEATAAGERIAIPLLLVVLLLVFRSVLAAAVPLLVGGAVVVASRGVLHLLLPLTELEVLALGAVGMMGLALGVDYSLLMVSRFREETARGAEAALAASRTVAATGRTVAVAGVGLSLAMAASALLLPGSLVASVAVAVVVAAALSVGSALLVTPAVLVLIGPRLDRWALPRRGGRAGPPVAAPGRFARRSAAAVLPVLFLMLAAAAWASSLDTEMESVELLPAGDAGRQEQEAVQRALGAGWTAPYEILVQADGPVTTPERLRGIVAFERRLERDPGIATTSSVGGIERATRRLDRIDEALLAQRRGVERLDRGLGRLREGAALNTRGLATAADGAWRLGEAVGAGAAGAGLLSEGLRTAGDGSRRLAAGIGQAGDGSERLQRGAARSRDGAERLASGLDRAREGAGDLIGNARLLDSALSTGERQLGRAEGSMAATDEALAAVLAALREMTVGRGDPRYSEALTAAERAATSAAAGRGEAAEAGGQVSLGLYLTERLERSGREAQAGMARLSDGAARLDRALGRLSAGSRRLDTGLEALRAGGAALAPAVARAGDGAGHLAGGLGWIENGAGALAQGLGGGAQRSRGLSEALGAIDAGIERGLRGGGDPAALARRLQGATRSGYFSLAAIEGSGAERRRQAALLIGLERGGQAARLLVVPRDAPAEERAAATRDRLEAEAAKLGRDTDTTVLVGGPAAEFQDLDAAFREQTGPARLVLALITILILIVVMRSLTVPPIAALLNLLTVAATFGLLALLFDGGLLGGPGFVDATVIPATIVVIFALAIDYEVFIFARMREEYERTGSADAAIANGLAQTAPVITGAAAIMIVVFLAFATSPFATIRQFGVAQAIAVAIDAFAIRLLVIPAVMRWLGPRAWWWPRWLGGGCRAGG